MKFGSLNRAAGPMLAYVGVAICMGFSLGIGAEANAESDDSSDAERPRVGLVLAGGGAKGAAHIGVLKVLEELRVPIDCIAGTSMGALVGGTYAAGVTAASIEETVLGNDWAETFTNTELRRDTPMRRKVSGVHYSNQLELGIKDGAIAVPGGLLSTQGVDDMIRYLVANVRGARSFDRLPIPFRAVATDVTSGKMVVFDRGGLDVAMRASMAIPGAFSPVRIDDMVLIDGGIVRNLPVDIARDACADVVIAVRLDTPDVKGEDLNSSLEIIGRTIDVVINGNERAQWQTLKSGDVPIIVEMGTVGTADFDRVDEAVPLGEKAARKQIAALSQYSVSPAEYQAWRDRVLQRTQDRVVELADVQIAGLKRVNAEYVKERIRSQVGARVDHDVVQADADRVFAIGEFEQVNYALTGDSDAATLVINAIEKPWGPDYLTFDLGLHAGSGGDFEYSLRADHKRTWMNALGGEWHNTLQIGRSSLLQSGFYQPLETQQRWFVESRVHVSQDMEDFYADGERFSIYEDQKVYGYFDLGLAPTSHLETRIGIRVGKTYLRRDTGSQVLQDFEYKDTGLSLSSVYDRLDSNVVPTKGWYGALEYFDTNEELGADLDYQALEMLVVKPLTIGSNTMLFKLGAGSSLGTDLPANDAFSLGGFRSLPGFRRNELRGQEYWLASVTYGRRILGGRSLFGNQLYGSVMISAGQMTERVELIDLPHDDDLISSIAFLINGRSPLGPVILGLGFSNQGDVEFALSLGRPINEGNLFGRRF